MKVKNEDYYLYCLKCKH